MTELPRRALRLGPAQMLVEPRHDLDEIAGPVAVIELVHEDLVPGVAAGAGRARQAEDDRSRRRRRRWRASGSPTCRSCRGSPSGTAWQKPSMRFSNSGSTASGVTSRPVKPVPPVVMTTSIAGSAIHVFTCARIFSTSSVTMARSASVWPAFSMRSASVAPDLSSASSRVSDTVSTAILSGMNGRVSSMPGIPRAHSAAAALNVLQAATLPCLIADHEPALALLPRSRG